MRYYVSIFLDPVILKSVRYLLCLIFLCWLGACTIESTKIVTDFDYVKLTETKMSQYYVKGTVRGMPFSYSTNDPFYTNTIFGDTTTKIFNGIKAKGIFFSIADESGYIPIWFYLSSRTIAIHDFVTNMYVNQTFSMGKPLGVDSLYGNPDNLFIAVLQVNYYN